MKAIALLVVASLLLTAAPASAAPSGPDLSGAAPCPGITTIGVVPYALCMAAYTAGLARDGVVRACEVVFGPGNC